jgi:hypothetical protein
MATNVLEEIVKNMIVHDSPVRSVTREELERRADVEAKEEAKLAYDTTYDDAYRRKLEELFDENGFSD